MSNETDITENFNDIFEFFSFNSFINIDIFNKFSSIIRQLALYIKTFIIKNNIENLFIVIPVLDFIFSNTTTVISIMFAFCIVYSCLILTLFHYIILIDSFLLSFIILQDCSSKKNCRRLAKNVISLFFSSNSCSIFNIIITFLLYFEISKPVSKFLLKIIKIFTMLLANYIPCIHKIYPSCKCLVFNDDNSRSE